MTHIQKKIHVPSHCSNQLSEICKAERILFFSEKL